MPQKPSKLMPALYGGIVIGVISAVPFLNLLNCLCCAGVMLGGFLSVFFYNKDLTPEMSPLSGSDAIQLGLLSGIFGAIIGSILTAAFISLFGNIAGEAIMQFLESYSEHFPEGTLEQMEREIKEGGLTVVNLIFSLIIDSLFGIIGGLLGFAVYKPTAAPPQPPTAF